MFAGRNTTSVCKNITLPVSVLSVLLICFYPPRLSVEIPHLFRSPVWPRSDILPTCMDLVGTSVFGDYDCLDSMNNASLNAFPSNINWATITQVSRSHSSISNLVVRHSEGVYLQNVVESKTVQFMES